MRRVNIALVVATAAAGLSMSRTATTPLHGFAAVRTTALAPSESRGAVQDGTTPVLTLAPDIGEIAGSDSEQLKAAGYVQQEFFLEGVAQSYVKRGEWTSNGIWDTASGDAAPYKIRVLARYPARTAKFNGVVFVEWLNVSGGSEGAVNFAQLHEELLRDGYAYVGVGAQAVGVAGLKKGRSAQRYASLRHPGDSYSYDIYSQAGRMIRSSKGLQPLGPLTGRIRYLLADGQSQSAGRMVTYVNAVHPIARVYNGFYIHSRSGGGAPLAQDADGKATMPVPAPARIRTDLKVPVMVIESETDVINFVGARQPDTPMLRVWELAGTSHADVYQLTGGGQRPMQLRCDDDKDPRMSVPVNDGPMTLPDARGSAAHEAVAGWRPAAAKRAAASDGWRGHSPRSSHWDRARRSSNAAGRCADAHAERDPGTCRRPGILPLVWTHR